MAVIKGDGLAEFRAIAEVAKQCKRRSGGIESREECHEHPLRSVY